MLLASTKLTLKQKLLSASALKVCWKRDVSFISFESLHTMSNSANPNMLMKNKLALCLFKLYDTNYNPKEFVCLNSNQILTSRQANFITSKSNSIKVGIKCLTNRLYLLNGKIPLLSLNSTIDTFKVKLLLLFFSNVIAFR